MQNVTLTLNGLTPEAAKSILAGLTSTDDGDASETTHTSKSKSQSATKPGKTTKKAAAEEEDEVTEDYTDDADETEAEEEEQSDFTVPQVQKLMAKLASEKDAGTAKKLLAKYKVKKVAELKQAKLNQLAEEVNTILED